MSGIVKFPFGKAEVSSKAFAATISHSVLNMETILNIGTLGGAATLNLEVNPQVDAGANLIIKATADASNRVLTFGTGLTAVAHTLTASKTYAYSFKYDGSSFIQTAVMQLN